MANDVTIPENMGVPAAAFRERSVRTESLSEGIDGFGFNLVTARGNRLYLRYDGEEHTLLTPGTKRPADYFDFVILQKAARKSHTFYRDGYTPGSKAGPTCQSTDGIAPDDNAREKQSELCDLCPHAEWKIQKNGRKGRACADNLRLAVLPMPAQIRATIDRDITEAILFRLPPASLKLFAKLGERVAERFGDAAPYCSYVVRATLMDTQWPQFEYEVVRFLDDAETEAVLELRETPTAYRILGLTPEGRSLVRRENANFAPGNATPQCQRDMVEAQMTVDDPVTNRLAAERADRIATMRRPEPLELQAEKVEPQVPIEDYGEARPAPPKTAVPDTGADLDAMVAAMRTRLPGA